MWSFCEKSRLFLQKILKALIIYDIMILPQWMKALKFMKNLAMRG